MDDYIIIAYSLSGWVTMQVHLFWTEKSRTYSSNDICPIFTYTYKKTIYMKYLSFSMHSTFLAHVRYATEKEHFHYAGELKKRQRFCTTQKVLKVIPWSKVEKYLAKIMFLTPIVHLQNFSKPFLCATRPRKTYNNTA